MGKRVWGLAGGLALLGLAWVSLPEPVRERLGLSAPAPAALLAGEAGAAAAPVKGAPPPRAYQGLSFAVGDGPPPAAAPAEPAPESKAERQRKQALRQLGYVIDERFYRMPLAELRKLAAAGNVQALTHLAERYLFELDGKPQRPGFEPEMRYREEARAALQQAYRLGNRHAAAMISESYLLERQPLEAAAWNLVARRAGDALSADWFLGTKDYRQLNAGQKAAAAERAEQIWRELHPGAAQSKG
ncbi:hypothetical protein JW897_04235 [Chromobacterium alkanivorans]|uniref:hypothetical protein n=1 Tax=Chromobacterium alkanivorans TaxID=1071719 RepID=UPI0019686F28|nr:hypothetical protein [Chromobacterium alkanivorans]MBN3002938.1 hypothetical protein [Chromobacterium alkanivorans]